MVPDHTPGSAYRLQIHGDFTLDDAAAQVPYLKALGVTHVYLSPLLQATPGSMHGYDVVAHDRISEQAGGLPALERYSAAARAHGLGTVLDIVPNHMAVPVPESLNQPLWQFLRDGLDSDYASWFDVDRSVDEVPLMPVLGQRLGNAIAAGEITYDSDALVLRYFDHEFPVRPGGPADDLEALLHRQHYRLASWKVGNDELNYRRFFDVTTLIAVKVEDPAVFAATHELIGKLVAEGIVDGLRVDHPDGLADPGGYLSDLAGLTGGAWVVAEKILEPGETLPAWDCAGTTGYDALHEVGGLFLDPAGETPLTSIYSAFSGEPSGFADVVRTAKREIVDSILLAEIERLVRVLRHLGQLDARWADHTDRHWRTALQALLVEFDVYRAYVTPGQPAPQDSLDRIADAVTRACAADPKVTEEIEALGQLVSGAALLEPGLDAAVATLLAELVTRFQQTAGPVMAKGVEDTAFYRYHRLIALNEVGGDPAVFGTSLDEFHAASLDRQAHWPASMTTLTTHDTKRNEDVRARVAVLSEVPHLWTDAVRRWSTMADPYRSPAGPDRNSEYLLWQTLAGAWPLTLDRALTYMEKATHEAKQRTAWIDVNEGFDSSIEAFVTGVLGDEALTTDLEAFVVDTLLVPGRINALAQRVVQLTVPGVPDVYQGTDLWDLSLVDPDNRRPVDYALRARLLAGLADAPVPGIGGLNDEGAAKLLVVSRALDLRRRRPELFSPSGSYEPLQAEGPVAGHVVAFCRGGAAVTVAPRLPVRLGNEGGWGDTTLELPAGRWADVLTGASYDGGALRLADLLDTFPVALLERL
ncbi:malto-oligosyltrehalose synthase [Acidothermaceae bacterium B102]|nr:malto-oligosyltrehalose synthase [Acidothermaceae bacterium B102]